MAISVLRGSQRSRPLRNAGRSWVPSIASLAFTAAIGLVLLMQSFAIEPGRSGGEPPVTAAAAGANLSQPSLFPTVLTQEVLAEQNANRNVAIGAPLQDVNSQLPGYAPPPPATLEPRSDVAIQALQAPTVIASSRMPEAPAVTATPEPAGISGCEEHGALYCVYEVQPGETLASIAKLAGLQSTEDVEGFDLLVASNRAALDSADDVLEAGEKLRIPLQQGILHTVISQETLSEIAKRYGVTAEDIVAVAGNGLSDSNVLKAGAEILVPNPTRLGRAVAVPGPAGTGGGNGLLSWPAVGGITSEFGPSHPLGVDIALMPGDPVTAAGSGTVTFSGGDPCCSYGLFVIIDHGNGLHTLYGHLSVLYVDEGDEVGDGERIGLGGYTGFGTGPHLHFEVHVDGMLADPMTYLP